MDGYADEHSIESSDDINYQKLLYIQELYETQKRIDSEIASLSSEIETMPKMPPSIEGWVTSFRSNFKLTDLTKVFKINKKYRTLMEERKSNGRKIKMFAIDNVLEQIKETESQSTIKTDE